MLLARISLIPLVIHFYRPSIPIDLSGYILYRHKTVVDRF